MRKYGFTLAEVLITLGIIGVVAALTLPNLQADVVQRQIGPKLAKAVSSFEQASEALLNERMADSLIDAEIVENGSTADNYAAQITDFLKATSDGSVVQSKDGVWYNLSGIHGTNDYIGDLGATEKAFYEISSQAHPHNNNIGSVKIDINGINPPNAPGEDEFFFALYDDGSLRPVGARNWDGKGADNMYHRHCDRSHTPNGNDLRYCAGYIFENNLKADYKID